MANESLISLKLSRSTNSTATWARARSTPSRLTEGRSTPSRVWASRSISAIRFGSPVRGSCRAWWASALSALTCAVTSREMPNVPMIRPSASRRGIFVLDTQQSGRPTNVSRSTLPTRGSPVRMMRCSSSNAADACSAPNTSKSVFPASSAALRPGAQAASQPSLTSRNRLCRSLK